MLEGNTSRVPIWLDCDTGHDDAFAILLAAHSGRSHLLGISTVHGNASIANTTYNTSAILEAIGRRDVPVYAGAPKPLVRSVVHAEFIHGESGLDGTTLLPRPVAASAQGDAVEAMHRALQATDGDTAWLVATGTLTNIALLFERHPELVAHIRGLSIMGGAIGGGFSAITKAGESIGNVTPQVEFNIYCDPEAARAIFSNAALAAKTTLVTLDLTHQVIVSNTVKSTLLRNTTTSPVRELFRSILVYFERTYIEVFGMTEGPPLHDPIAVFAALTLDALDDEGGRRYVIDVECPNPEEERTKVCGKTSIRVVEKRQSGVRVPIGIDQSVFWSWLDRAMSSAEQMSPLKFA